MSPATAPTEATRTFRRDWGLPCVQACAAGLLMTLWWIPPEAAAEGETSWRAIAWLILAVVWSLPGMAPRVATDNWRGRWHGCDIAVFFLVGGQVLGGLQVLLTSGHKRTAANLLIEWLGLAAAWWVLRGLAREAGFRAAVTRLMWSAAIAAAGLGLWQHHVALPEMAREYGPRIAEARTALAQGQSSAVVRELAAAGIPTSEPGLTLFEQRLLASREPFGMFGLANTFAGLLASALLWLLVSETGRHFRVKSPRGMAIIISLAILGWCLMLTKSRTALLGLSVGLVTWGLSWLVQRDTWRLTTHQKLMAAGVAILLAGLPAVLILTGAWDWQVLAEAPKSLVYRWQYWVASLQLIRESPWLGVGLGQFRQQYLRVKLPAGSEEIADPHNLWCDAWLNGGILSIIGLLIGAWCLGKLLVSLLKVPAVTLTASRGIHEKFPTGSNTTTKVAVVGGGLLATPVLLVVQAALGAWDDRLLCVSLVVAVVYGCLSFLLRTEPFRDIESTAAERSALIALMALLVHLHGAGGFEMPGVMLWCAMLLSFAIATIHPSQLTAEVKTQAPITQRLAGSAGLALLTAAVIAGLWWPAVRSQALLAQAELLISRNPAAAVPLLKQAAEVDPWTPAPWYRLAELSRQEVLSTSADPRSLPATLALIDQVDRYREAAQARDPFNPQGWEHRAETAELRYSRSQQPEDLETAVTYWSRAVAGYPTNSRYLSRLAFVAEQMGNHNLAESSVKRAIQQDDLNRELGHRERWLPPEIRTELEALLHHPTTDNSPQK